MSDMERGEDILKDVADEVQKLGALTKENIESLKKNYSALTSELKAQGEKVDGLTGLKLDRLASDISLRQEEIDKEFAAQKAGQEALKSHLEKLDLSIQRNKFAGNTDQAIATDVKSFCLGVNALRGGVLKAGTIEAEIERIASGLPAYQKAFDAFLRQPGDERALSPDQLKALSVGSDPDGGFAVTPAMSARVLERLYEMSPIRALAGGETISTDSLELMADIDDSTSCGWATEQVAGADTNTPKMAKAKVIVHEMYARVLATQQLLEDAAVNIEAWLGKKVADKMARTEGTAFVTGTGIGQPRGFLTYANGTTWGTIEQVNMGNASTLTADGFVDVKYAMIEQYLNRGTWLMNRAIVALAMKLKTTGGGDYVWKPSMLANDPTSTILGLPVRMCPDMPTKADNALAVALADWTEAYLVLDRLGISLQRDPYTRKPYVEFYFRKRLGGDVVNFQAIKIGKIAA